MKPIYLSCTTISDAWFRLLYEIFDLSYRQSIQKGSFENEQYRLQYPGASIYIKHPDQDIVPVIPAALDIPAPTTMDYINDYFANYIMDPTLAENETYKYATRIHELAHPEFPSSKSQLNAIIEMLTKTPLTNQAVLEIAKPTDVFTCYGNDGKLDPPCLRVIDFKAIPLCNISGCTEQKYKCDACSEKAKLVLTVTVYFRSWDLWAGFPTNLGGIELLKQYVADQAGLMNGPMYAYSAGLHIYGYQEKFARIRTMKEAKVGVEAV